MTFIADHLAAFENCYPSPPVFATDEPEGRGPAAWFKGVDQKMLGAKIGCLPASVNRRSLVAMAADRRQGTPELCISIFAWGGMRGNHRDLLFGRPLAPWITVADLVRDNRVSRAKAYDLFAKLRQNGSDNPIAGMGPAYFTKLLYFLAPDVPDAPKGYIMDQWLGCSVNLLTGREVVKLDQHIVWRTREGQAKRVVDSTVSNVNTGLDYEAFCQAVEQLSSHMGESWSPELTERALISDGGRNPHRWRDYVVKQRVKALCAVE
jgi:hypothetical protein